MVPALLPLLNLPLSVPLPIPSPKNGTNNVLKGVYPAALWSLTSSSSPSGYPLNGIVLTVFKPFDVNGFVFCSPGGIGSVSASSI